MASVDRRKALWIEFTAVSLLLVVPPIARSVSPGTFTGHHSSATSDFLLAISYFGQLAALLFIIWNSGDSFKSFGIVKDKIWRIVGLTALLLIVDIGISLFLTRSHRAHTFNLGLLIYLGGFSCAGIVLETVISATLQEALFRCYLITRLEELLGNVQWAMVISVLAFGVMHTYEGAAGFIQASIFGLIFAIVFVRTRSLVPLAAAHTLFNLWVALNASFVLPRR